MNLIIQKAAMRKLSLARRRRLDPAWAGEASIRAQRLVRSLDEWESADIVFCYIAMPGEVLTADLMSECRRAGKTLCVPAFRKESNRYEPALFEEDSPVARPGASPEPANPQWLNIAGPRVKADPSPPPSILAVVPGIAFDGAGNRLGRGGGHYDRMLSGMGLADAFKTGLAFEFQVLPSVPADARDVRMNAVVTEENVYRMKEKSN